MEIVFGVNFNIYWPKGCWIPINCIECFSIRPYSHGGHFPLTPHTGWEAQMSYCCVPDCKFCNRVNLKNCYHITASWLICNWERQEGHLAEKQLTSVRQQLTLLLNHFLASITGKAQMNYSKMYLKYQPTSWTSSFNPGSETHWM